MECTFKVGQKVVCVSPKQTNPPNHLVKDKIYVIESLVAYSWGKKDEELGNGHVGVILKDHPRELNRGRVVPFGFRRFRPLVEDKEESSESIRLFRLIADGVTKGQPIIDDPVYTKRLTKEHQSSTK